MTNPTISGHILWEWRQQAIAQATAHQIEAIEVDWLLQRLCQVDGLSLRLGTLPQQAEVATTVTLSELENLWQQRIETRVPIQYLVGYIEWRQFELQVSPAVLIPRPETELMIDLAIAAVANSPGSERLQRGVWADLGTGSGAIALGLAIAFPQAKILAVDVSEAALKVAQGNARQNGLGDRIQFLQGSWLTPLSAWQGQLAGIVSNPPYIPSAIVPTLQPEVAHHEPHLALDGGQDGLHSVRHLIQSASAYLQTDGLWLVELMQDQPPIVATLLAETQNYQNIQQHRDLAGRLRFVSAHRAR
ncbi:MAG: peptide chain release factor N(5)-glutamine methyltransferase [Cyanobacteria bacterium P01_H01_bin.58]